MNLYSYLKNRDSVWKFRILKPYLVNDEKMMDFGCGDLALAKQIAQHFKKSSITGIDVINLKDKNTLPRVTYTKYDGNILPFNDNSFDTAIIFYVLHHCENPIKAIEECIRVSKKRIIVVESIPEHSFELPFMCFFDWFFNVLKFDNTPLPFNFKTKRKWIHIFKQNNFKLKSSYHPRSHEDYLPFGKMYVFEFVR